MKVLTALRITSQAFFLGLFVYILWSTTYPMTGPLAPETFFVTNPSIMIFASLSEGTMLPGIMPALVMLGLTVALGRFFCGWICPLGAAIDAAGSINRKRKCLRDKTNSFIRSVKYFFLAAILACAMMGLQTAWIVDPLVMAARFVSLNFIPAVTFATDRFFIFLIRDLGLHGAVYDAYRSLGESILGVKVYYFANAGIILAVFLAVISASLLVPRLWCRAMCPLGALYSIFAWLSPMRRVLAPELPEIKIKRRCRMGAIKTDLDYVKSECILCMDCVYDSPGSGTRFTFTGKRKGTDEAEDKRGISRSQFLFLMAGGLMMLGAKTKGDGAGRSFMIRPPGALDDKKFITRCVRCGNCMKVCPTNVLQPSMLQSGLEGIWTPHLVNEIGYCEYNCNACGNVCPTHAIPKLAITEKRKVKLGTAVVDKPICIAWGLKMECLVCEEHCPVPQKAIKIVEKEQVGGKTVGKPLVDANLCIGCGICQNKCPARPKRAIRVGPRAA